MTFAKSIQTKRNNARRNSLNEDSLLSRWSKNITIRCQPCAEYSFRRDEILYQVVDVRKCWLW